MLVYTNSMKTETSTAYYLRMFDLALRQSLKDDRALTSAMWGVKRVYCYYDERSDEYLYSGLPNRRDLGQHDDSLDILWMARLQPKVDDASSSEFVPVPVLVLEAPSPYPVREWDRSYTALIDLFRLNYIIDPVTFTLGFNTYTSREDL